MSQSLVFVVHSPGSCFGTGSAQGRRLMGPVGDRSSLRLRSECGPTTTRTSSARFASSERGARREVGALHSGVMSLALSLWVDRSSLRPDTDGRCSVAVELSTAGSGARGGDRPAARTVLALDVSASMNGDKLSTLHYLFTLSQQHGMVWVGTGMMPSNKKSATRNDLNYVASFSGAMATSPSDAGVDEMLPGDLETARQFGARVAQTAARWAR